METLIRYAADRGVPLPIAFTAAPAFLALATVGPVAKWLDLRRNPPKRTTPATGPRTKISLDDARMMVR